MHSVFLPPALSAQVPHEHWVLGSSSTYEEVMADHLLGLQSWFDETLIAIPQCSCHKIYSKDLHPLKLCVCIYILTHYIPDSS